MKIAIPDFGFALTGAFLERMVDLKACMGENARFSVNILLSENLHLPLFTSLNRTKITILAGFVTTKKVY